MARLQMKRVLAIAYYFPPEGSAGTYRSLRFVRHLPHAGWLPTVICAEPQHYERHDPELLESVPPETDVIRVRAHDLWQTIQAWREARTRQRLSTVSAEMAAHIRAKHSAPLRTVLRRSIRTLEAHYYQPDAAKHWIQPAMEAALKVCERRRHDVLWATAGPVSAWIVARQVSQRTGVPYVLDLRDPWGLSSYDAEIRYPKRVTRRLRLTMHDLFKGAQAVVFLSDSAAAAYCHAFAGAVDPTKIYIIPNGYEGAIDEFSELQAGRFTVLYAGTIASYRYDSLLDALRTLKDAYPVEASKLRLRFVGEGMEALAKDATRCGLGDILETGEPTSNAETTRLQRDAHALLVLGRLPTIPGHELFAGAKVFGYLKAGRPIVGILPQDETRKILAAVGVTSIADVESPPAIVALLQRLLASWSGGTLRTLLPDRAKCEVYLAERQTEALARALQGAPALDPFVPGAVEVPPSLRHISLRYAGVRA
jgi:glycosyltransferase involved in cell wall biosynthesis